MKTKFLFLTAILSIGFVSLSSFKTKLNNYTPVDNYTVGNPWDGYKSWTKITAGNPNTGDPTGFLEKRHNGQKAFREIYINSTGAATQQGHAPYKYSEGTILVKETFKNKAAYDKGSKFIFSIIPNVIEITQRSIVVGSKPMSNARENSVFAAPSGRN